MAVIYLDRPVQEGDPIGSVYDPTRTQDFTSNNLIPFSGTSVGTNTQTNQIPNTGGEFDFFNALQFNKDFTKEGLGGYGTALNIIPPIVDDSEIPIDQATGIQTVAPINNIQPYLPITNQGNNDGDGGIPSLTLKSTYNAELEDEVNQTDLEAAKKDTNFNNLINMGLIDKAKEYVKNNYGYMIMNLIFPGSGYAAKVFIENKKKKEAASKKSMKAEIQTQQTAIDESETAINKATEKGVAINKNEGIGSVNPTSAYGKSKGYTGGSANPHTQSGWSGSSKSSSKSSGGGKNYGPYSKAQGGRIRYGEGGIVTL